MIRFILAVLLLLVACEAQAYIGPGSGIAFLGSLWAWLVAFVVVLLAILIWPIRWMLRRLRTGAATSKTEPAAND